MGCVLANVTDFYLIRPLFEMEVGVPRFMGIARLLGRHAEVKLSVRKYHDAYAWGIQDKVVQRSGVLACMTCVTKATVLVARADCLFMWLMII